MTNQEINERVAKLCGWERKPFVYGTMDDNDEPIQQEALAWYKDGHGFRCFQKNYADSLDACREFEDSITGDEVGLYEHFIGEITQSYALALRRSFVGERMKLIRSTPLQRCEAFLQLKGQWE